MSEHRYRYEAKIQFVLAADSLDEAYQMAKHIAAIIEDKTNDRVTEIYAPMLHLHHRPDLEEKQNLMTREEAEAWVSSWSHATPGGNSWSIAVERAMKEGRSPHA